LAKTKRVSYFDAIDVVMTVMRDLVVTKTKKLSGRKKNN
jgi:hypothetical protein